MIETLRRWWQEVLYANTDEAWGYEEVEQRRKFYRIHLVSGEVIDAEDYYESSGDFKGIGIALGPLVVGGGSVNASTKYVVKTRDGREVVVPTTAVLRIEEVISVMKAKVPRKPSPVSARILQYIGIAILFVAAFRVFSLSYGLRASGLPYEGPVEGLTEQWVESTTSVVAVAAMSATFLMVLADYVAAIEVWVRYLLWRREVSA